MGLCVVVGGLPSVPCAVMLLSHRKGYVRNILCVALYKPYKVGECRTPYPDTPYGLQWLVAPFWRVSVDRHRKAAHTTRAGRHL